MNKRAIAILGGIFLLIVGTLGFLIYSKYSSKPAQNQTSQQQTATTTQTSNANSATTTAIVPVVSSNIIKLTDDHVVSPALFFNGSGITYFDSQGELFQASLQNS